MSNVEAWIIAAVIVAPVAAVVLWEIIALALAWLARRRIARTSWGDGAP